MESLKLAEKLVTLAILTTRPAFFGSLVILVNVLEFLFALLRISLVSQFR